MFDHLPWCGHAGVVDEANSMGNQHCCHCRGAVEHFYLYEEGDEVSWLVSRLVLQSPTYLF